MATTVSEHIEEASAFGQRLEDIIVSKGRFTLGESGDREKLLLAYWALIFDLDKSILALMRNKYYGGAFALLRPIVEAEIRAHVVLIASDKVVASIKDDTYKTNFREVGGEIDTAFGLDGFFERYLNGAKGALHSFTHSGLSQLGRRFNGNDIEANYDDGEIIEVIHNAGIAVFMVTNLVARHFKLDDAGTVNKLFIEWGTP